MVSFYRKSLCKDGRSLQRPPGVEIQLQLQNVESVFASRFPLQDLESTSKLSQTHRPWVRVSALECFFSISDVVELIDCTLLIKWSVKAEYRWLIEPIL